MTPSPEVGDLPNGDTCSYAMTDAVLFGSLEALVTEVHGSKAEILLDDGPVWVACSDLSGSNGGASAKPTPPSKPTPAARPSPSPAKIRAKAIADCKYTCNKTCRKSDNKSKCLQKCRSACSKR